MEMLHSLGHYENEPVDLGNFIGIGGTGGPSYREWLKKKSKKNNLKNFNEWLKVQKKARIKKYGKKIYGKR